MIGSTVAYGATSFSIDSIDGNNVYVRNTGLGQLSNVTIFFNGNIINTNNPTIPPNTVGVVAILSNLSGSDTLKVSGASQTPLALPLVAGALVIRPRL